MITMEYNNLGNTGISVSRICFGSLTVGPLQKNLSLEEGSRVLSRAIDLGINFVDTADLYGTYPFIKNELVRKPDLVVATKSYAYDTATAQATLERALKGIGRDYIDIFLLHEQEGPLTLKGHEEALQFFIRQKEKGRIRAVGISTHFVAAVRAAAKMKEIDVIHPILNFQGLGIVDGSREDMEQAVSEAWYRGKGIYTMKPFGGGHLLKSYKPALDYILNLPYVHSVAMGMQRLEEVDANINYLAHRSVPEELTQRLARYERELIIQYWCQGCGECIKRCRQGALVLHEGKAQVDKSKCILCGYCGSVCKELAIKVI
jgi:aryl-alcohol dehydrogenase-like predicted oxidoreductase